nr:hypothetical protein [Tanacetum cinerariifolium]
MSSSRKKPISEAEFTKMESNEVKKEHIDMNPEKIVEQNHGKSKYFLFEDNELTLIEDYDDNHVYNEDTYRPTYINPDCYYEEADAIKEVQFYPYDKDIHYLIEQIRGDIEELEKKKKKNDVMRITVMLMWGRIYLGKLTLMVRNPCVWPAPMNKMAGTPLGEMADQTVMGSVHNSDHGAFASGYSCGGNFKRVLLWLKNLNVDKSPIVQSVSIQDKPSSYIAAARGSRPKPSAAGGSKLDPSISKAKFHSLFLENLCEGVYVSIPRKVVETDVLKEGLTIGVYLIEDMRFTIKTVSIPITGVTPVVHAPIVEMTNDGF